MELAKRADLLHSKRLLLLVPLLPWICSYAFQSVLAQQGGGSTAESKILDVHHHSSVLESSSPPTANDDAQILLQFKSGITQDPGRVLDGWDLKSNSSACSWTGVTCDVRSQRVIGLNLTNCQLEGSIAPGIGQLHYLQSLVLSSNNFSGPLPGELGNLSSLEDLDISFNQLNGTLPSSLGSLRNLTYLFLKSNQLTGQIPASLGNCSNLSLVDLASNSLTGYIPSSFDRLLHLRTFRIHHNDVSGPVPRFLGNLSELQYLHLGANRFSGTIPPELGMLSNLTFLSLSANQLGGTIPASIFNASELTDIELQQNLLTGSIPREVGNLGKVLYIYFWRNNLSGQIPASISNCRSLIDLELSYNELTGSIPPSLGNISGLQELYLRFNRLTGRLPDELQNLTSLGYFLLDNNLLSGGIPSWIDQLKSLSYLELYNNFFTGSIPSSIGNIASLVDIGLAHNQLTGPIPPELGKLFGLQYDGLDLSYNQLSGSIPAALGSLQSAVKINLAHNNLSGKIPSSLGDCVALVSLDLSLNHLDGVIPQALGQLRNLKFLNVSYNSLYGPVPSSGNFTAASFLGNPGLCGEVLLKVCNYGAAPPPGFLDGFEGHEAQERLATWKIFLICITGAVGFLVVVSTGLVLWVGHSCCARSKSADVGLVPDLVQLREIRNFTYKQLWLATDGFSESNLIGTGARSSVFKGQMRMQMRDSSKSMIAVKRLDNNFVKDNYEFGDIATFINEIRIMSSVRHRNLLKILGVCFNSDIKALVLEYMPNGSLDTQLHEVEDCKLDWIVRLKIALGVADALVYLHHDFHEPVIHCDLKPRNVLLNSDFEVKVADFGISKILNSDTAGEPQEDVPESSFILRGTTGYMPPEYAYSKSVSTKADVYSYGLLLLELLTGKKPTSDTFEMEGETLVGWVRRLADDHQNIFRILDERLLAGTDLDSMNHSRDLTLFKVVKLALQCANERPEDRPSMQESLGVLTKLCDSAAAEVLVDTKALSFS